MPRPFIALATATVIFPAIAGCFYDFSLPSTQADGGHEEGSVFDRSVPPLDSPFFDSGVADGKVGEVEAGGSPDPCILDPALLTILCDRFSRTIAVDEEKYQAYSNTPTIVREGEEYVLEVDADLDSQVWLDRRFENRVSRVTFAFRMSVLSWPPSGSRHLVPLRFKVAGGEGRVFLRLDGNTPDRMALVEEHDAAENGGSTSHYFPTPSAGYHRYVLRVDLNSRVMSLEVDGAPQLPEAEPFPQLAKFIPPDRLSLLLGAAYAIQGASVAARFDDVVVAVAE